MNNAERNYCATWRELLAVVKATKHFRPYLYGHPFLLRTDHPSLLWLRRRKEPSGQVARWLEILSEFQYKLQHRPGTKHGNADGLSCQCEDCRQCAAIEKRDGGPTRQEIIRLVHLPTLHTEAKLVEDQGKRRDHSVAKAYALLQAGPPIPSSGPRTR